MHQNRTGRSAKLAAVAAGIFGACVLLLGGCSASQERAYCLEVAPTTGPLAIDIENFRGNIELRTVPDLQTIQVIGEVRPAEQFKKPVQDEIFKAVAISAKLEEEESRGTLRVRSTTTRTETDDHHVDLTIFAPRCDGLRVVNSGGLVLAVNTSGATDIHNRAGSVEVRTSRPMVDQVTITTTDGSIYYQVPPGSTGRFDLQTLEGMTSFIDRVGQSSQSHSGSFETYTGTLNEGTNDVVARTNNGDVRVWVIENPVALTRMFRTRVPDIRDSMYLHGNQRFLRNLPVDHPEVTGPPPRSRGPND